ncbi:hypothetical protein RRG08_022431 [Elysia crispata]|uniref:Uncharacterized protein n=1 Tax=Elysia crispata TaxID=231223 RepID=A0AAE1D8U7_9GAST|nr:hypothetical protein RRG08_022431 [Elysia crispata]
MLATTSIVDEFAAIIAESNCMACGMRTQATPAAQRASGAAKSSHLDLLHLPQCLEHPCLSTRGGDRTGREGSPQDCDHRSGGTWWTDSLTGQPARC